MSLSPAGDLCVQTTTDSWLGRPMPGGNHRVQAVADSYGLTLVAGLTGNVPETDGTTRSSSGSTHGRAVCSRRGRWPDGPRDFCAVLGRANRFRNMVVISCRAWRPPAPGASAYVAP